MSKKYFNSLHGVVISQNLTDFSYNKHVTDNLALHRPLFMEQSTQND